MKSEKLTLRMEGALIEKAKRNAKERGISVSRMVAGFFDSLQRTRSTDRRRDPAVSGNQALRFRCLSRDQ